MKLSQNCFNSVTDYRQVAWKTNTIQKHSASNALCRWPAMLLRNQQGSLQPLAFASLVSTSAYVKPFPQQRIWRPTRIRIHLLSLPQRSQTPDSPTWQAETATRERTSSSVTYVCRPFWRILTVLS